MNSAECQPAARDGIESKIFVLVAAGTGPKRERVGYCRTFWPDNPGVANLRRFQSLDMFARHIQKADPRSAEQPLHGARAQEVYAQPAHVEIERARGLRGIDDQHRVVRVGKLAQRRQVMAEA